MDKWSYSLLLLTIVFVSLMAVSAVETMDNDFDGLFNMSVPAGEEFVNAETGIDGMVVYNYDFEDGDPIDDNIVVYYFNQSFVGNTSGNFTELVINHLDENTTFKHPQVEDGLTVFSNQMIQHDGSYMVFASNDNDTEAVGVVGNNLDDLKNYANSIKF